MTIRNVQTVIKLTEGRCRKQKDGSWGRGTKALSGLGDYSLAQTTPSKLFAWSINHQEAEAKTAVTWVSPASYDEQEQAAWEAVYPGQHAAWKATGFDPEKKPFKLARSKDRENTTAQFWAFDIDGDPDPKELETYNSEMELWVAAGRPKGKGPTMPTGRGISPSKKAELIEDFRSRGWALTASTTFSSATKSYPGNERLRFYFIGNESVDTNDDFDLVWRGFQGIFRSHGVEVDRAPRSRASIFYAPAYPPGHKAHAWGRFYDGALVPVAELKALGEASKKAEEKVVRDSFKDGSQGRKRSKSAAFSASKGEWLPADTVITLSNGQDVVARSLDFKPGKTIPCFSPVRHEDHPSAFVAMVEETGRVYIHDSCLGTTFRVEGLGDCFTGAIHLSPYIEVESKDGSPQYFSDQVEDLETLLPNGGVLFVRAPLKIGKTWWCQQQAKKVDRVCAVTDSVALAASVAGAYGCEYYSNCKDPHVQRLGTTIHSLGKWSAILHENGVPRIGQGAYRWDLLVADEISSIRSAIHSETLSGISQWAKESLILHTLRSRHAVFTSADFSDEEMDLFESMLRGRNPNIEIKRIVIEPTPGQRTIQLFMAATLKLDLFNQVEAHVKGEAPIVVFLTSTKGPQKMARLLSKKRPDLSIGWISADNSGEFQEALKDPDGWLAQYDILICSPSIKAGLSWTIPVKAVYAFFTTPSLAPRDLGQMLMRVRNPDDTKLKVSLCTSFGQWDTDPKYIETLALGLASKTEETIDRTMIQYREDWQTGTRIASDPELLKSWVFSERERRGWMNNYDKAALRVFTGHRWPIEDHRLTELEKEEINQMNAIKEEEKIVKEELLAEKTEALQEADDLTDEEAKELSDKHGLDRDQKLALEKHNIEKFYGQSVDENLVLVDKDGRTRSRIRAAVSLMTYQESGIDLPAYRDYMNAFGREGKRSRDIVELRHHALRVKLQDQILRLVFDSGLEDAHGKSFSLSSFERLGEWLSKPNNRRLVREVLGQTCTSNTVKKPTQWFSAFLRNMGVGIKCVRSRKDNMERKYTIDLSFIRVYGKAEMTRTKELMGELRRDPKADDVFALDLEGLLASLVA